MENKDQLFRQLMKDSKMEMPFMDFEDRVMQSVEVEYEKSLAVLRDRKRGIYFFLSGMLFGIILNYMIMKSTQDFGLNVWNKENLQLISQLVYAVLVLFFIERLYKLFEINKLLKGV